MTIDRGGTIPRGQKHGPGCNFDRLVPIGTSTGTGVGPGVSRIGTSPLKGGGTNAESPRGPWGAGTNRRGGTIEAMTKIKLSSAGSMALRDPRWVHPELKIGTGRPVGLVGTSGCGKSFLAAELALSLAAGRSDAWGTPGLRPRGRVALFAPFLTDSQRQIFRLAKGHGLHLQSVKSLTVGQIPVWEDTDEQSRSWLFENHDLVVFDSLTHLTRRGRVAEVVGMFQEMAALSDKTGCTVLIVHQELDPPDPKAPAFDVEALDAFWSTLWVADIPMNGILQLNRQTPDGRSLQAITLDIHGQNDSIRFVPRPPEPPC